MSRKKIKALLAAVLAAVLLTVLAYAVFSTYNTYTETVIQQRQQHLLIIARAVSQSLDLYLSEQLRDVEILVKTPGFAGEFQRYYRDGAAQGLKEYLVSYMISQSHGLSRVYLLDREGNRIFEYNQYPFLEDFDESILHLDLLAQEGEDGIGSVFELGPGHCGMTLVNNVYHSGGYLGTVVGVMDLENLYDQFVAPLNIRAVGQIVVRDQEGTVIMHPDGEMIAFNPCRDIPGLESDPQYSSLRAMLEKQYANEEGTAIYRSYSGDILPTEEEITAFSRMNLMGTSWYISVVMPYREALQPVNANLGQFGLLVTAILAVMAAGLAVIYRLQKNRQKLQMETRYLKDINRTLEELQESREQVRHYQKLQTIGVLAGGIAHEFNNLLTPIMGYSEFLRERLGPRSEYYEDIDEIYKAGARAKEIVEQILPFSRRENDSEAYFPVSLDAVLRDAVKMVQLVMPSSIRLETELDGKGMNVLGSATQLHQVLLNLCSNAYQAMEENGGVLTISCRRADREQLPLGLESREEEYARVVVSDTGCGMDEELIRRIFDPFFTTKEAGEGTGLGLSVVQNIVSSHRGVIQVKSSPGQGSSFILYLPLTSLPAAWGAPETGETSARACAASLLLVDDDAKVTRYLKKRLERRGCRVDAYIDPQRALEDFGSGPGKWDLLLADYTMPGCRGTELARRVRNLRPGLPVVLLTGLVEKEALEMRRSGIIDEILVKPLDFEKLLQVIDQLTQKDKPEKPGAEGHKGGKK